MGAPPSEAIDDLVEEPQEQAKSGGLLATLGNTPGWVWIVIGGIVLLVVGLLAARTALPQQGDFKDIKLT